MIGKRLSAFLAAALITGVCFGATPTPGAPVTQNYYAYVAAESDDTEYGVAWGWYFGGHNNKIQVDYRVLEYEGLQFGGRIDTHQGRVQYQLIF